MAVWHDKAGEIGRLIAAKSYKKAITILCQNLKVDQENIWLRQQLADVLVLDGQNGLALQLLGQLADSYAQGGFHAKAIAVIKRMQRIDSARSDLAAKLASIMAGDPQQQRLQAALKRPEQSRFAHLDDIPPVLTTPVVPVKAPPVTPIPPPPPRSAPAIATVEDLVIEFLGMEQSIAEPASLGALGRSLLFSEFSQGELAAVVQGLKLLTYEPGEILVTEGEPGTSLFVLASGTVRIHVRGKAGRNRQVRVMDEGEFFGEISLVTGAARTATVTAASPCELLELNRSTLGVIGRKHPQVPTIVRDFCDRRSGSREEMAARDDAPRPQ